MWDPNTSPMQVSDVLRTAASIIQQSGHHHHGPGNVYDGYDVYRAIIIACGYDQTMYDMSTSVLSRYLGTHLLSQWNDRSTGQQVQDALIRAAGGWYD